MSTSVREIKLERTIIYRLNLGELRLLKDLVRQLTGSSSFTGRITIDCCTGGIGEVSSRGGSERIDADDEKSLTDLKVYDTHLIEKSVSTSGIA